MFSVVDTGIASSHLPFSGAVRAGNVIYTAQIPKDPETGIIVEGDITVQTRRALQNLKQVMEAAGGSLKDVAQVLVFLADGQDFAGMNKVYTQFFSQPYPNRATVVVKEFVEEQAGATVRVEFVVHAHVSN